MKIKVLSWNIWCGTYLDGVIEFLKTANADIIALQEVAADDRGNIVEIIAKKIGYEYAHGVDMDIPLKYLPGYKHDDERTIKYGTAILSKYKINDSKTYELSKSQGFRRLIVGADIQIEDNVLHVFSIHLKHTHQKHFVLQDLEAENLIKLLPAADTIVMGDFNALPESSVIQKMSNKLQNTEIDSATPTWSVYKEGCTGCLVESIKYKLDYIFTSKGIKSNSFTVHASKSSDHLPVSAIIEI